MFNLQYAARACVAFVFFAALAVPTPGFAQVVSAPVTTADLAKLQESIQAMRQSYEARINALEQKINTLQQQNAQVARQPAAAAAVVPATAVAPAPSVASSGATTNVASATVAAQTAAPDLGRNPPSSLGRGIVLPKIGPITPEISLILDGKYSAQSQNPESLGRGFIPSGTKNIPRGFSLGESELALAGTVDNLFRAEARFVLSQDENGTSFAVEEAFFETLGLPEGFKLKGGKYFSDVGYLNNKHPHEWDFVDLPLAYQAFLGGQLNNTGVQLKWVAPLEDMYLRFGGEYAQGGSYPNSNNFNQNKPLLGTLFALAITI